MQFRWRSSTFSRAGMNTTAPSRRARGFTAIAGESPRREPRRAWWARLGDVPEPAGRTGQDREERSSRHAAPVAAGSPAWSDFESACMRPWLPEHPCCDACPFDSPGLFISHKIIIRMSNILGSIALSRVERRRFPTRAREAPTRRAFGPRQHAWRRRRRRSHPRDRRDAACGRASVLAPEVGTRKPDPPSFASQPSPADPRGPNALTRAWRRAIFGIDVSPVRSCLRGAGTWMACFTKRFREEKRKLNG